MPEKKSDSGRGLSAARREYMRDMKWIQSRFGMVPRAHAYQAFGLLIKTLDALETQTPEAEDSVVQAFKAYHTQVLKGTVWEMLEQTKNNLKAIQQENPRLFLEKRELWNEASSHFTNFGLQKSATVGGNYRKALAALAKV